MTSEERRRVLIVDDEPDIVLGLRDALEFENLDAVSAPTGAAALAEVRRGPIAGAAVDGIACRTTVGRRRRLRVRAIAKRADEIPSRGAGISRISWLALRS